MIRQVICLADDDKRLSERVALKDEKAFEEIVRLYGGLIKSIVKYHLKNMPMWQEDCINEILMNIWCNMKRFDPEKSSLKNWIGACSKYRCIDFKRRYCRELLKGELDENIEDVQARTELLKQETEEEINSLLAGLDSKDREIFIKRYLLDKTIDEISVTEGRSPSYVYNRLSRGRKKLRRLFGRKGWGQNEK